MYFLSKLTAMLFEVNILVGEFLFIFECRILDSFADDISFYITQKNAILTK